MDWGPQARLISLVFCWKATRGEPTDIFYFPPLSIRLYIYILLDQTKQCWSWFVFCRLNCRILALIAVWCLIRWTFDIALSPTPPIRNLYYFWYVIGCRPCRCMWSQTCLFICLYVLSSQACLHSLHAFTLHYVQQIIEAGSIRGLA